MEAYRHAPKRQRVSDMEDEENPQEPGEQEEGEKRGMMAEEEEEQEREEERRSERQRTTAGEKSDSDSRRMARSPVVHVRNVAESVVEADLVQALQRFGKICYVLMMPFKHQALVEFSEVSEADRCVSGGSTVYVCGVPVFFNYSSSQRINRPTNTEDPHSGNKVLLLSIHNPLYPITTPTRLNVIRNNKDAWDYTKPFLGNTERGKGRPRQAILGEHPSSYGNNGYGSSCPLLPFPPGGGGGGGMGGGGGGYSSRGGMGYKRSAMDMEPVQYPLPHSRSQTRFSSPVAMVTGLNPLRMNCTRLFNLFCLYGNVEKIKFMRSVPGTALVEMGDEYAVDRAVTHLNSIQVFGKQLTVCVSKQHSVVPSQVFQLEDGSNSFRDFSLTRNNRFSCAGQASKNIIQPPSCVLHYYNAPASITDTHLHELCSEHKVPGFVKHRQFDTKPGASASSGLLEFESKAEAVETLTVLNHQQIRIPEGSNPHTLKLCFSTSSHL
ncbi:hypothetical protein DNTS_032599 [Danionella cerebrum]|uniref:RRM domain-containing protein n=1 Tax=Danionella cerebrum TaxID=2873325 RepID=A0A553PYE4_9TELE|nr:hypothetical protein DNTS_032599 [Danionella translucida]